MAGGHHDGGALAIAFDPGSGLVAAIALALILTTLALTRRPSAPDAAARPGAQLGGIESLLGTDRFEHELRRAERRAARPHHFEAVVRARIDHLQTIGRIWGDETRREAAARVADVMRSGLRANDAVHTIPGNGFVIVVEGAREAEAERIVSRLRRTLARTCMPGMGDAMRVTASFAVAEARAGESRDAVRIRAEAALDAATIEREDCVIMASEIEEILFLPPPAPIEEASVAKAA